MLTPLARQFKRTEPGWNWRREGAYLGILLIFACVVSLAAMSLDLIPLNPLVPIAFFVSFFVIAAICVLIFTVTFPFTHYIPVWLGRVTMASLALMALAVAHIFVIGSFWQLTRDSFEAYPDKVIPQLEAYRQTHGSYPTMLNELQNIPATPKYLEYYIRGPYYIFSFDDQSTTSFLPADYIYSSENHEWRDED